VNTTDEVIIVKTLIIYQSIHHHNTETIAREMGDVLSADLRKPFTIKPEEVMEYDLVGFGSGIYFWKHHQALLDFASQLPKREGFPVFIFSTHGAWFGSHQELRRMLVDKKYQIIGEFDCPGWDSWGIFKYIGGLYRGRPNTNDCQKAQQFAEKVLRTAGKEKPS